MQVKIRNPQFNRPGVWFFDQPEFFEFEGTEVAAKWLNPNQMGLTTDNPEWPMRVIDKSLIVTIDNLTVESKNSAAKTFTIPGSKGTSYTVTVSGTKMHCTCSGFQFRKSCKHLKEVDYA